MSEEELIELAHRAQREPESLSESEIQELAMMLLEDFKPDNHPSRN